MSTSHVVSAPPLSVGSRVAVVAGFALHAVVGALVIASGLVMPAWAIVALAAVWVVALVAAIRQRHRPLFALLTPVLTFGIWYVTGWAGETYLSWTA
jgi:hypothetical protein